MNYKLPEHSKLMRTLLVMGKVKLAWACRRLHCPVPASALVLEVGSGGSPYFRANVLIDAYAETLAVLASAQAGPGVSAAVRGTSLPVM